MSWTDAREPFRWRELLPASLVMIALLALFHGGVVWGTHVFCGGDLVNNDWPLRAYWLREGFLTGWYSASFSGYPFFANTQAGVLYPPNLLYWCGLPIERAATLLVLGHMLFGGLGAYALMRIGVGRAAALFAAMLWMCGGYQTMRLTNGVVIFTYGMNWIPWMARAAERCGPGNGRATAALGVAGGMQFLAGAPQLVHIAWGGLLVWIAARVVAERGGRALAIAGHAAAALALTAAIAFPQLVASREFAAQGVDRGGDGNWAYIVKDSLAPRLLATQFVPALFDVGNAEATYWGSDVGFLETNAYIGLPSMMLAAFGAAVLGIRAWASAEDERRRALRWLAVLLLLALGSLPVALGQHGPVYRLLFDWVPGFAMFRVPSRWLLWSAAPAMVLAGIGVQAMLDEASAGERARRNAWLAVAAASVLALAGLRALLVPVLQAFNIDAVERFRNPEAMEIVVGAASRAATWALAAGAAAAGAGALAVFRRYSPRAMVGVLAALVAVDLMLFWAPYRTTMPLDGPREDIPSEAYYHRIRASAFREFFYPETPLAKALQDAPDGRLCFTDSLYSFYTDEYTREIYADRPSVHGIESMRGYYPLLLRGYVADVEEIAFADVAAEHRPPSGAFLRLPALRERWPLDAYNGRNLLMYIDRFESPEARDELLAMGVAPKAEWMMGQQWRLELWENPHAAGWAWLSREAAWPGLGGRVADAAPAAIERSADRTAFDIDVPRDGLSLHFAEVDYPGWRIAATRGDERVEGTGRTIALGAGTWHVERTFHLPGAVRAGLPVAAAAFLAGCALVLMPRRRAA